MEHPFSSGMNDYTVDELDRKYNELMNRFHIARRMGMDQGVLHQLDLLLLGIENEKMRRMSVDDKPNGSILETDPLTTANSQPIRKL
jgi:hypothetical protein